MMTVLFLLAAQAVSSFMDPGSGWKLYENVNRAQSTSARITSTDARSFLIVRCDRAKGNVISIQYVPHEAVGIAMGPVALSQTESGGRTTDFNLTWEPAVTGAYARDGVADSAATAAVKQVSEVDAMLTVRASNRDGQQVEQMFESAAGRDQLKTVVASCQDEEGRTK